MKRHSAAYLASPFVLLQKHCKKHTLNVVCMSYTTFKVNMWQVLIELFVITVEIFAETSFFMWFLLVSSKTFRSAIPENVSTKRLFYFILTYADTTRNLYWTMVSCGSQPCHHVVFLEIQRALPALFIKVQATWSSPTNETNYSKIDQAKFLKAVFHKFYWVHSWIFCPRCSSHLYSALR